MMEMMAVEALAAEAAMIHSAVSGVGSLEGVGHDGGEGRHHQDQGQIGEDDEQLLGALAPMLAAMTSPMDSPLVADGGEQSAEVMDAAEEDTADQDPQHHRAASRSQARGAGWGR